MEIGVKLGHTNRGKTGENRGELLEGLGAWFRTVLLRPLSACEDSSECPIRFCPIPKLPTNPSNPFSVVLLGGPAYVNYVGLFGEISEVSFHNRGTLGLEFLFAVGLGRCRGHR